MRQPNFTDALLSLGSNKTNFRSNGSKILDWDISDPPSGIAQPTKVEIDAEVIRLQAEYDGQEYARSRLTEYPSVQELVVALYDTEDKSAVEAKRAIIKAKYPKPD